MNIHNIGYQTKKRVKVLNQETVDSLRKIKEVFTSGTKGEHYVMQLKALQKAIKWT